MQRIIYTWKDKYRQRPKKITIFENLFKGAKGRKVIKYVLDMFYYSFKVRIINNIYLTLAPEIRLRRLVKILNRWRDLSRNSISPTTGII